MTRAYNYLVKLTTPKRQLLYTLRTYSPRLNDTYSYRREHGKMVVFHKERRKYEQFAQYLFLHKKSNDLTELFS